MKALTGVLLVAAFAGMLWPCRSSHAVVLQHTIHSPKDCPSGLSIKSKAVDVKMLEFDVSLNPEQIATRGKGRVGAYAFLSIGPSDQRVATVTVQGVEDGKRIRYQFRLSPAAAKSSELQLSLSHFEEDGSQTVGGGVILEIHLAGWAPAEKVSQPKTQQ